MIKTYILIETKVGQAVRVARRIHGLEGVRAVEVVTGPFDVIARVDAESLHDLAHGTLARIHAIEGITHTLTCPIVGHHPVWEEDLELVAASGR
jgi:DNA-binding Lrp family transcriptional regulator